MATAGRTVAFSGLTVAISLAALLLFPQVFLRSMGFGGMAAVLVAMVGALTVLPALLAVLGPRVDALRIPVRGPRPTVRSTRDRRARTARGTGWRRSVMRRPVVYVAVIVPFLLLAGPPFLRVEFGGVDHRALPGGHREPGRLRDAADRLPGRRHDDASTRSSRSPTARCPARTGAGLDAYVDRLAELPGVRSAEVTAVEGRLRAGLGPARLRGHLRPRRATWSARSGPCPRPTGAEVLVGGRAADLRDLLASLGSTLPWMALFVVGVTFVLLFLAFGSVVLPVKAIVMNVLSLSASFGALVLDLPGRAPVGAAGLHLHRHDRGDPADPDAGDRVRPVDGLRGVPAVPDPRAVGPHRATTPTRSRPGCSAPAGSSPARRCCSSW